MESPERPICQPRHEYCVRSLLPMTEDSLHDVESRLGIRLPESYRELHRRHADRLQRLDWSGEALTPFYLTAEHAIAPNLEERRAEMGTACAFPNWWDSF